MLFTSKISALTAQVTDLTNQLQAAVAKSDQAIAANAQWKEQGDAQAAEIADLTAKLAAANGENAQLKTEKADLTDKLGKLETNLAGKVIETIAAAGVPPVARVPAEQLGGGSSETRTDSGLKGFSKVQALIKAQIEAK